MVAILRASWVALDASRIKSSSSCRYLSNSSTTSSGLRRRPSALSACSQVAIWRIRAMSLPMTLFMPGRSTLTATGTGCPVFLSAISAKWTWAIEALAMGSRSKLRKTSGRGRPKLRSMVATATLLSKGGTRSCSSASSAAISGGSKSARVDSTCPNLTKMGPRASSASRKRWPRGASSRRPQRKKRVRRNKSGRSKLLKTTSSRP